MNTKLNNVQVNPEFADLFSFESKKERTEHNAQMISYRILSAVEKVCDEKNIKKKDLAAMVGTSRSYITQLFRGSKQVNTFIMAKFEEALEVSFQVNLKFDEESQEDFLAKQLPVGFFSGKRLPSNGCVMYCYTNENSKDRTSEIVQLLQTENQSIQKAV